MKSLGWVKQTLVLLVALLFTVLGSGCAGKGTEPKKGASTYPEKNITGIIQWGAGGTTDILARAIAPLAEKELGKPIVLQNMPGATGTIATQYVFDQKPDGYTLLFGAENPSVYQVLGLSERNYGEFEPINIYARGVPVVVVQPNARWKDIQELIEEAKQKPKQTKMGSTGTGGVPFMVGAMMKQVNGVEFNMIPFDGDGPAVSALLGGHIEAHIVTASAVVEHIKAGKMRALAVINHEPVSVLPDVPPITKYYPEYRKFLPWGPFFGVFVKKEVPDDIKAKLVDAFKKAYSKQEFQDLLKNRALEPLGISGEEARKFLEHQRSVSSWLLYDVGAAKKSPEEFGIKRIQ